MSEGLKRVLTPPIFKKDIEKDMTWIRCPKCRKEYNKLTDIGVCPDCETKINKAKKQAEEKKENEYLLDKVDKEIGKVKHRADIDD